MKRFLALNAIIFNFFFTVTSYAQEALELIYTANAGVQIISSQGSVFIDSHFRNHPNWGGFKYSHLNKEQIIELESGKQKFSGVKLILATHIHRDHFHPEVVGQSLQNNPDAILFANQQIAESVLEGFVNSVSLKTQIIQYSKKQTSWQNKNIKATIFPVAHSSKVFDWIDNSLILVEVDGHKFLHIGDATNDYQSFAQYQFPSKNIDTLITPYWFLFGDDKKIITELIKPKNIVAIHLPPQKEQLERIKQALSASTIDIQLMVETLSPVKIAF